MSVKLCFALSFIFLITIEVESLFIHFFDNLDFLFCALPVDIFYLFLFSFLTFSYFLMGDI